MQCRNFALPKNRVKMNRWNYVTLHLLAGTLLFAGPLSAQESKLTIDGMFELVEQSNTEVKIAKWDVDISNARKKAAEAMRLPDVGLSADVSYIGDGIVLDRNFTNATRSPMPHLGNNLTLSVYQPVYAGGEISAGIEHARRQTEVAANGLDMVTDKMKMDILQCYLDLFKHRNLLVVYDENIELMQQLISEMEARSRQGLVLGNDVTRYELNLSNLNYDRLTVSDWIEHLNRNLLIYLDLDEGTVIVPELNPEEMSMPEYSLADWKAMAWKSSPQLRGLDLSYAQSRTSEKLIRSSMLPKIGLAAEDNLGGPITNCLPVLDNNLNSWWVGVKFSFNISSFYKDNNTLKATRLESARLLTERKSQEENIDRQLDRAYKYYVEACEQVRTQLKNVELATENYRIVERRYSNDLSLLTDMLDASASKLDAEVRLVNARTNVIYYYYQLKYISGTL